MLKTFSQSTDFLHRLFISGVTWCCDISPLPTLCSSIRNWHDQNVWFCSYWIFIFWPSLWEFCFHFNFFYRKNTISLIIVMCVMMAVMAVRWSVTLSPHKYLNVELSGCVWSVSPGWLHRQSLTVVSVFQGNRGGTLRVRLHSGHPVLRHQGSAAIPDRHR